MDNYVLIIVIESLILGITNANMKLSIHIYIYIT